MYIQWASKRERKPRMSNYHVPGPHLQSPPGRLVTALLQESRKRCRQRAGSKVMEAEMTGHRSSRRNSLSPISNSKTLGNNLDVLGKLAFHTACWPQQSTGATRVPTPPERSLTLGRHCFSAQQLPKRGLWGYFWASLCSGKTESSDYSFPPPQEAKPARAVLSTEPCSGLCSQLPPSPPPHPQSGLLITTEPAPGSKLPFVSEALGWLWRLESLNNNDESEYLFLRFSPSCLFISS